ncbi:TNF receptor-associated factor 2-like [Actinia tenebrosa]|uniref:TNF receptor-associated factor 2-like n=1 Tax=Actinia tenebrosa TaxID=6105 RepID=A0A6P8IWZ7_ACTTE|nr:TNF receptor-associated factor 2-like [Actinia tenebrosa]XP_031570479.1 TNF receptor-associated factor 2-like [Actinia tenebrosa]XP_031570480.1 TNF receptor-associated factor 2-like [Actinia tenebrosa]XP_031570482.1 TNF receptor-associated factor 2-like [Actinia tenebrosa]XP_031570483.1 TNF receptor-associated factor 2-like [Actinia tenebrosa]XP_031570484.1 TNF receptor-associated factor 2-like [Actinia tenebrosa]
MNTPIAGYEIAPQDRETVNPEVLCSKCKNIVRNALQTPCGHRYCADCLESEFIKGQASCEICNKGLTRGKVFRDKFCDREIQNLILFCIYCIFGCKWKGELRHRGEHQKTCEFAPISCINPKCDKKIPRSNLAAHLQDECLYRELACSYCGQPYVAAFAKEHEKACPAIPTICPSCGKEFLQSELKKHRDTSNPDVCEVLEASCPFVAAGCKIDKPMKRQERKAHMEKNTDKHLNLLLSKVLALSSYLDGLLPGMRSGSKNGKLIPGLREMQDQLFTEITTYKQELESRIQQLEGKTNALSYASLSPSPYGNGAGVSDLVRRLDNSDAKSASHDLLLNEAHATIAELRQELAKANQKVERAEENVRKLENRLAEQEQLAGLRNLAIADLEEKFKDSFGCSYDGIMLFKITQVARKRADAVSGRQISFYSPAFYTDPHGYKMCARIYLNGDGMGKGSHISLFFVVMRGEYDALLQWPFRQKVTMMLLDQDNEEHVIDAFRPDPSSSSFQRPRGEMNIASGCPLFCPHSELQRHAYIRDDTMFVKIIVDRPDWK